MSVPCSVVMKGRRRRDGHHLLGQHRGGGMRNRVVHVQQVEIVVFGHFRHARCQRQAIRRILKQRIVGHLYFVIVDAGRAWVQPDRIGVGDEMDVVAAGGQFQAQLRGDDAAAAVSGIAGNSDSHALLEPLGHGRGSEISVPRPICP